MKKFVIIFALAAFGSVACSPDQQSDPQKPKAEQPKLEQAAPETTPPAEQAAAKEAEQASGEETAAEPAAPEVAEAPKVIPPPAANEDDAAIRERLSKGLNGINPEDLRPSPVAGLYEVSKGMSIGYVSIDGRYLIEGDLLDLQTETNLTDLKRNNLRKATLAGIPEEMMIIFEPKEYQHTVTIFTDVDCGYCRKLHAEIGSYLKEGIRVRYVFYPLRGENAASYKKAENVWCSKDRLSALTLAKQGKEVKAKECKTPVAVHLATGMAIGIRGTPGIISETGELLPGYMPAKTLKARLEPAAETEVQPKS